MDPSIYPLALTPTPPALKKFCFDLGGIPTRLKEVEITDEDYPMTNANSSSVSSQQFGTPTTHHHLRQHLVNASALGKDIPVTDGRRHSRKRQRGSDQTIAIDDAGSSDSDMHMPTLPRPAIPSRPQIPTPLSRIPEIMSPMTTSNLLGTAPAPVVLDDDEAHTRNLPSPTASPTATTSMSGVVGFGSHPDLNHTPLSLNQSFRQASRTVSPSYNRLTPDPPELPPLGEEGGAPFGPVANLNDLPKMISSFDLYPEQMKNYVLLQLLKRCPSNTLQFVTSIILPTLKRDFLSHLPVELAFHVLEYLDLRALGRCASVSRRWRRVVEEGSAEVAVWKKRIVKEGWYDAEEVAEEIRRLAALAGAPVEVDAMDVGDVDERSAAEIVAAGRRRRSVSARAASASASAGRSPVVGRSPKTAHAPAPGSAATAYAEDDGEPTKRRRQMGAGAYDSMPMYDEDEVIGNKGGRQQEAKRPATLDSTHIPHFYKNLYRRHHAMRQNWLHGRCKTISFPGHGQNVVTCLQFDNDKIVSGSDDHTIHIYDCNNGTLRRKLNGHDGGVWALQYWNDSLVSGSTDRTVRVWDMDTGVCTHLFEGHTSTVRCLMIVPPSPTDIPGAPLEPSMPLIVTGSRDATLRVWRLPNPKTDEGYMPPQGGSPPSPNSANGNPYFMHVLTGHTQSVRAIAGYGRVLVSGSYDCTVRVWDLVTGEATYCFRGHREKVYSVGYCHELKRAVSGSMDATVRVWCTKTGFMLFNLEGHSSLVGLLELSPKYIVSAAADATLRIWSPTTGQCLATLTGHQAAITCFHHEPGLNRIVSGSDGGVKVWELSSAGTNGLLSAIPSFQGNAPGTGGPGFAFYQGPNGPQPVHGRFVRDLVSQIQGVWRVRMDERRLVSALQREGNRTWFEVLDFGEGCEAGVRIEGPGDGPGWMGPDDVGPEGEGD
ncbi:SCF ubiquitin ligase complex subunit cdc4, partial [Irineochytrium annulatum]